jgi:hypothetical protein
VIDFYHVRALRYRGSLWQSHLDSVSRFVRSWNCPPHLILIGPSAGYSLPLDWLARFDSLTVVEPGWFARRAFGSKLVALQKPVRHFGAPLAFERPGFLDPLGADLSRSGVLFCNVLGQVRVKSQEALHESLQKTLAGVSWASYHDRFSASDPVWTYPDGEVSRVYPTEELIPPPPRKKLSLRKAPVVQEHLASDALSSLAPKRVRYWDWQITPRQVHLIEGMIQD